MKSSSADIRQTLLGPALKAPEPKGFTNSVDLSVLMQALSEDRATGRSFEHNYPELIFRRNQYRFIKTLGAGAFATVVEAEWLPKHQHVAVKMIEKSRIRRDGAESLLNEVEILCRVNHPNLLRILDWGFGRNTCYLVTEM